MDWRRAGRYIQRARSAIYPTQAEFAAALGMSETTVRDLERGRRGNFKASTLARVEAELDWLDGEIEHLAGGGRPRRQVHPPDLREVIRAWPRLSPQVRAIVVGIVRDARTPRDGA